MKLLYGVAIHIKRQPEKPSMRATTKRRGVNEVLLLLTEPSVANMNSSGHSEQTSPGFILMIVTIAERAKSPYRSPNDFLRDVNIWYSHYLSSILLTNPKRTSRERLPHEMVCL